MTDAIRGWLVMDKPLCMTSAHVVHLVKKKFDRIKVGHAGTLDPLAQGVLPLALGEATKTVPYVMMHQKSYAFEAVWGEERTTDDREGSIVETSSARPSAQDILDVLKDFQGCILQTPPPYSALKIQGRRACDRMRQGEKVSMTPRWVHIFSLCLSQILSPDRALFEVTCGPGTYVRALVRDMGKRLGCFAYAGSIDRLAVGPFEKKHALSLERLASLDKKIILRDYVKEIPDVLDDIPAISLLPYDAACVRKGQGISKNRLMDLRMNPCLEDSEAIQEEFLVLALDVSRKPVSFLRYRQGQFWPERVFNATP